MEDYEDEDAQHQPPHSPDNVDEDGDEHMGEAGQRDETSQLIKNLVRYALACEYSRTPIRRDGIREKGTDRSENRSNVFKPLTPLSAGFQWTRV